MADATQSTREVSQAAKEQAGAVWNDAKELARAKVGEQQQAAAKGLGDFAGALREAARKVEGGQQAPVARMAHGAADGLERLSGTLRSKDLEGVVRDAESFARSQPVVFFGAAVAVGFLAMRFMKASEPGHAVTPNTPATTNLQL